jgi:hypothetical protein
MKLKLILILAVLAVLLIACDDDPIPGRGCVNPEGYNNQTTTRGAKTYRCVSGTWRDEGK